MESAILEQLQKLPESGQQEALRYIEELVTKYAHPKQDEIASPVKKRQAGMMKGTFVLPLADDFNTPLEDFQEYMT
jgi:Protein of unknown function (DUF2281)